MLELRHSDNNRNYHLLFEKLMSKQQLKVKDFIINVNNRLNRVFYSFNMLSTEFSSGNRLVDIFYNHFSFHSINRKSKKSKKTYNHKLNDITL